MIASLTVYVQWLQIHNVRCADMIQVAYASAWLLDKLNRMCTFAGLDAFEPAATPSMIVCMATDHYFTHAKATRDFHYMPMVSLEEGLVATCEWAGRYRSNWTIPRAAPSSLFNWNLLFGLDDTPTSWFGI